MIPCEAEGCGRPFDPIVHRWLSPCCHLKHSCCDGGPAPERPAYNSPSSRTNITHRSFPPDDARIRCDPEPARFAPVRSTV